MFPCRSITASFGFPRPFLAEQHPRKSWNCKNRKSTMSTAKVKRYYEKDGSLAALQGKTIAIIGYGSQGHAHALNLRDSGLKVVVGLYEGSKSKGKAEAAGLQVLNVGDATKAADFIMILLQDHLQGDVYKQHIAPNLTKGKTLMFAH